MKIFKNFNTLVCMYYVFIQMDKKKKNEDVVHHNTTYFHEVIVDVSKLFTNDERKQENIQLAIYSIAGIFTGLAIFNNNKKKENSR
jgi:hypothetical protein